MMEQFWKVSPAIGSHSQVDGSGKTPLTHEGCGWQPCQAAPFVCPPLCPSAVPGTRHCPCRQAAKEHAIANADDLLSAIQLDDLSTRESRGVNPFPSNERTAQLKGKCLYKKKKKKIPPPINYIELENRTTKFE